MYPLEQIEIIIEALELLYKKRNGQYYKEKVKKQLEYWYYERTVIQTINNKDKDD